MPIERAETIAWSDVACGAQVLEELQRSLDLLEGKDVAGALSGLAKTLSEFPEVLEPYVLLARIYAEFGDRAVANELLEAAVNTTSLIPEGFGGYIELLESMGRDDLASTVLENRLQTQRSFMEAVDLAKFLIRQKDYARAAAILADYLSEVQTENTPFDIVSTMIELEQGTSMMLEQWQQTIGETAPDFFVVLLDRSAHMCFNNGYFHAGMKYGEFRARIREQERQRLGTARLPLQLYLPDESRSMGGTAAIGFEIMRRRVGWEKRELVVVGGVESTANHHLTSYYLPEISVITDCELGAQLSSHWRESLSHYHHFNTYQGRTIRTEHLNTLVLKEFEARFDKPLLSLTAEDEEFGWDTLRQFGLRTNDWFVAVHMRENPGERNGTLYSPRDVRDLHSYFPAFERIQQLGGWIVRLGSPDMTPLPCSPRTIDLAHSNVRSPRLDVFCWAKARFYMGSASGPSIVPTQFGTPCLHTNWLSYCFLTQGKRDIFLPKLFREQATGRFRNFHQIYSSNLMGVQSMQKLDEWGLELVENEPAELVSAVEEMIARTSRVSLPAPSLTQRQFTELVESYSIPIATQISETFLRQHPELLAGL